MNLNPSFRKSFRKTFNVVVVVARTTDGRTDAQHNDSKKNASRTPPSRNPNILIKCLFTMTMDTLETTLSVNANAAETSVALVPPPVLLPV